MERKQKRSVCRLWVISGVFLLLSALWLYLVTHVDIASVGPMGTSVGLSKLNQAFFELTEVHVLFNTVTDWLGLSGILVATVYAVLGLVQWIKRKNMFRVDGEILAMGVLYLILIGTYVFFEINVVNYRPIIMPGCEEPEASFPSSHTLITIGILGSAVMTLRKYISSSVWRKILTVLLLALTVLTVVGRILAGVHWFSDIVGGLLFAGCLLSAYRAVLKTIK